jgi:hypothetical protein
MAGLFGGGQPTPTPKPPAPMPDPDSPAVHEASRREQERVLSRAGRRSTILTDPGARTSDSYSGTTLGAGV